MKIALHQTGEISYRAGRILLGDRRVDQLGLIDQTPSDIHGGKVVQADSLAEYDVVATDATEPQSLIRRGLASGASCAVWAQSDPDEIEPDGRTVLIGANLATGIAPCLAYHEVAMHGKGNPSIIAWTEPGNSLRSGEPLAFPDPIGGRWGKRFRQRDSSRFVAPLPGEWAGALAQVTISDGKTSHKRIIGVADLASHLEALALAAGALAIGMGKFTEGKSRPVDSAEAYLKELLNSGLDVAASTIQNG